MRTPKTKPLERGDGSIYQRKDGRWAAQLDVGVKPNGKRDRRTIYGKTEDEVGKKLRKLREEKIKGTVPDAGRLKVGEHLERWLDEVAANTVRPVTLQSYRITLEVHALPFIGQLRLAQLTPSHLQTLYSDRLKAGKSRRTVQYLHSVLKRAFAHAVKLGMLSKNPTEAVEAPKPGRHEFKVLMPDDLHRLMAALDGDPLGTLYRLAIDTGARRGELVALRWADVTLDDPQGPAVHINRTAELVGNQVVWSEPKTAKSRRRIPITPGMVVELRKHMARQNEQRAAAGEYWEEQGLVFTNGDGSPVNPGHVSQHFLYILRKHGLPEIRLHDLRHTHATTLLAANVHPKLVAERLGHSTTNLTMDTYSHVLPTMQQAVVSTLDALLNAAGDADELASKRSVHRR